MSKKEEGPEAAKTSEPEKPSGNGLIISPWAKENASKRLGWNADWILDWSAMLNGVLRRISWIGSRIFLIQNPSLVAEAEGVLNGKSALVLGV